MNSKRRFVYPTDEEDAAIRRRGIAADRGHAGVERRGILATASVRGGHGQTSWWSSGP